MNKSEFEISGITAWHEKGITGKGIRIANMEETDPTLHFFDGKVTSPFGRVSSVGKNHHGHQTADILHQVAPDATLYGLSNAGQYSGDKAEGRFIKQSIPFMESEEIHLVNASLGGTDNAILKARIEEAQQHGVTFVTSAGNEADSGPGGYARSGAWIAVGAVHLSGDGKINHASYSSIGDTVDFTQFSNLYVHDARKGYLDRTFVVQGTSFSSPMLCGMLALVQQLFLEKSGRTLTQDGLYAFMQDHCIDLWKPGKDTKSGYGLFLLPEDPESIDIAKYIGVEEDTPKMNNPEYIIIHHSATAQGDAETFRRAHMAKGWRDIGYHYVINNGTYQPDGLVEIGRTEYEEGAHAINYNARSIGICLVGDFNKTKPTVAQMTSLETLVRDIMTRHKIPVEEVLGHGDVNETDCPGKNFDMKTFREELTKVDKTDYEGHWAKTSIDKAKAAGIMAGYPDGTFKPDQAVTRAELAVILDRLRLLEVR